MGRMLRWKHLPALVFVALVLVVAAAGAAFGGSGGTKTIKKVATKQINKLAPGLSVAHAGSADTANTANTAASAAKADDASKVGGAQVCSGTVTLQDNESRNVCGSSPLFLDARCIVETTIVEIDLELVSETQVAWTFGESIDDSGGLTTLNESNQGNNEQLMAQAFDTTLSPDVAEGGAGWVSAGAGDGRSLGGTFSVRANRTGSNQGDCQVTSAGNAK